jgi:hypothetical protein
MEKSIQHISNLTEIAIRQFHRVGRGSFLIVFEINPNESVYLPVEKILDGIKQLIPEALNYVQKVMNDYDPQKQFVVINVFNRTRIAITRDALRIDLK